MQAIHSRRTTILVLIAAFFILGTWTFYTQSGVMGKADAIGYAICHRIPERSFIADGRPLPLCARCTGIYLGVMTGLGTYIASGRFRTSALPHWHILAAMGVFVVIMGIDGLNSYVHLFPGGKGIYEPQNWLRLTTGVFVGITAITLVLPVFNQSIWENVERSYPPLWNFKELAGLSILAALMVVLTLSTNGTILLFLGFLSALGVLILLTMMMMILFVTFSQHFRAYHSWRELWVPGLAGLVMAIAMIGIVNFARYQVTGSWSGFVM
jgi:uncharacterized membrane protein